jgi:hypothetical protein
LYVGAASIWKYSLVLADYAMFRQQDWSQSKFCSLILGYYTRIILSAELVTVHFLITVVLAEYSMLRQQNWSQSKFCSRILGDYAIIL